MIHSPTPTQSKPRCITSTEFTFCNLLNINDNENPTNDENNLVFTPSFKPISVYSGYNCSSPTTKARNKILEMMNNLPESCHELSLKDIVVDDLKDVHTMVKQTSFMGDKPSKRKRPISRSVSLDTGVFMLKMFVPSSFGKKKSRSSSRMCKSASSFSKNDSNITSNKSNTKCTSTNIQSRNVSRHTNSTWFSELTPRWFINKPSKPTRQRGCIF